MDALEDIGSTERMVLQLSIGLRKKHNFHGSNSIIHRFCCNCGPPHNPTACIQAYFDIHPYDSFEKKFGQALISLQSVFSANRAVLRANGAIAGPVCMVEHNDLITV